MFNYNLTIMRFLNIRLILILSLAVLCGVKVIAQSNKPVGNAAYPSATGTIVTTPSAYSNDVKVNYVRKKVGVAPISDLTSFNSADYKSVQQHTNYTDGLGRSVQTVVKQFSSGQTPKDLVRSSVYNQFGVSTEFYLPYVSSDNNGTFKLNPFNAQKTALQAIFPDEDVFYAKADREASPLRKVIKSYAEGNSWAGSNKGKEIKREFNTTDDHVQIWGLPVTNLFEENIPSSIGEYLPGQLDKKILIDEEANVIVEYWDKGQKLILRKVQNGNLSAPGDYSGYNNWLSTYYVYDEFDQLRFVMPPKTVKSMVLQNPVTWTVTTENLCFWYVYDERGRLVGKKTPDQEWMYIVYDNRDRPVFTQDGNMRPGKKWAAILYDELNRPVITGMITFNSSTAGGDQGYLEELQAYVAANTGSGLVSNLSFNYTASTGSGADIFINNPQTGVKNYKAANSINLAEGFLTDNSTDFTAEIGTSSVSGNNETIAVNDNPVPPGANLVPLVQLYYDEYNFKNKNNQAFTYSVANNNKLDAANNLNAVQLPDATAQSKLVSRGSTTGIKVRIISNQGDLTEGGWITKAFFFDEKKNLIQAQEENYRGGNDITSSMFDFSGKILSSYSVHNNPQNSETAMQNISVKTNLLYDHAGRLLEIRKKLNDDDATERIIVRCEYDVFGKPKTKRLAGTIGNPPNDPNNIYDYINVYTSDPLEILDFDYNVRGWLKGINKDYANGVTGVTHKWFGLDLSYDWGFDKNQLSGNVSGVKWRSKGDEKLRAYGYDYDKAGRLQFADFTQKSGSSYIDDAVVNFDVQMGELVGGNWINSYDDNGNILKMKQWGLKLNSSSLIDDLSYTYYANSNKLKNVIDAGNDPLTFLGDFRSSQAYLTALGGPKTSAATDYEYDANGNIIKDRNKDIEASSGNGVQYNYLNLPWKVKVKNKGVITYIYDALGNKLEKIAEDNSVTSSGQTSRSKSTLYLNGFVYENNLLSFVSHEEGRIRVKRVSNQPNTFVYDYFVKDNLGNVRVVLTDEQRQDTYPVASLEDGATGVESDFYYIQSGNIVPKSSLGSSFTNNPANTYQNNNGNPPYNPNYTSNTTANSDKLYRLNGSTANRTGLGITLKVMTGDVIDIYGKSYYKTNGTVNNNYPISNVLTSFINIMAGTQGIAGAGKNVTGATLNASPLTSNSINSWLQNVPSPSGKPKAYINWILMDEQFRVVTSGCGFDPVDDVSEKLKSHYKNLFIEQSGYLYVYCSNESNQDVYFDNLQLIHTKGPLVETNEYYPFGLLAAGISYKNAGTLENYLKLSGNELQANEFASGTGLELYDFNARTYDAQIGRFMNVDPLSELDYSLSPYRYAYNNPVSYTDKTGMHEDWYEDEQGEMHFDDRIQSQKDLDRLGISGKYWGDEGDGLDDEGRLIYYHSDGSKEDITPWMNDVTVGDAPKNEREELDKDDEMISDLNDALTPLGPGTAGVEYQLGRALKKSDKIDQIKRYNESWRIKQNSFYKTRPVNVPVPGVSRHIEIPRNTVKNIGTGLKVLGGVTGVVSAVNDINKYQNGEISGAHLTVNLIMNGVGFLGPIGTGVSILYGLTEDWWW